MDEHKPAVGKFALSRLWTHPWILLSTTHNSSMDSTASAARGAFRNIDQKILWSRDLPDTQRTFYDSHNICYGLSVRNTRKSSTQEVVFASSHEIKHETVGDSVFGLQPWDKGRHGANFNCTWWYDNKKWQISCVVPQASVSLSGHAKFGPWNWQWCRGCNSPYLFALSLAIGSYDANVHLRLITEPYI